MIRFPNPPSKARTFLAALVAASALATAAAPTLANDPNQSWMRFPGQRSDSTAVPDVDRSFVKEWEANPPKGYATLSAANIEPMKAAIKRYADIAERGGWQPLPEAVLSPGMANPAVGILRERLLASGDLKETSGAPDYYDFYIEKAVKLKSDIKGAMTYPVIVVVMAVVVISVIMIVVIPSFTKIFKELLGGDEGLPLPTQIVVNISHFLVGYWWLLAITIAAISYGIKMYYATPKGNRVIDNLLLKTPIIGPVIKKVAVARFARTLSTLLSSGVAILEALDITARTSGNVIVQEAILKVRAGVERGQTLVEPLNATGIFPNMVGQMIGIGEQTGALDTMLGKIADFYEQEVDAAVANLLTLIEPLMIGFLGVSIGGIVIAMYLPLFSLIGKLSNGK